MAITITLNLSVLAWDRCRRAFAPGDISSPGGIILLSEQCGVCAVTGCADPSLPRHAVMRRDNDDVIIWCNNTSHSHQQPQQWQLMCDGSRWIGTMYNCSTTAHIGMTLHIHTICRPTLQSWQMLAHTNHWPMAWLLRNIVVVIPSSLLKVGDRGTTHQSSPTLPVSCYCCALRLNLVGPILAIYDIVAPPIRLLTLIGLPASCAMEFTFKNVCTNYTGSVLWACGWSTLSTVATNSTRSSFDFTPICRYDSNAGY